MKIEILKEQNGMHTPFNNEALFQHCSGGMQSVTEYTFDNMTAPLLFVHGVSEIVVVDQGGYRETYKAGE